MRTPSNHSAEQPSPTIEPLHGSRTSEGAIEFGIKVGQYIFHPKATNWFLESVPAPLASKIRSAASKGFQVLGNLTLQPETHLQEAMNGKLFMNTVDAAGKELFEEVPENYLNDLFPHGKPNEWPNQLVFCTKDIRPDPKMLRNTMLNFEGLVHDVTGSQTNSVTDFSTPTKDKTVIIGSYSSERDILNNAGAVLNRGETLRKNPLSLDSISLASQTAGQALLDMVTLRNDGQKTVLRDDTADIFRHVMGHGYSQGGNTSTDIFRYVRSKLHGGGYEIALDAQGTQTAPANTPEAVAGILKNSYLYVIAGADVTYSPEELKEMPPRDHSRCDQDQVINGAIGTNRQQPNYRPKWQQEGPNEIRQDRLLETRGPKKKLFGIGEAHDSFHGFLGHLDDDYQTSVVEFGKDELKERWLPRFCDQPVAADITFRDNKIQIEFERGCQPATMKKALASLTKELNQPNGVSDPYRVEIDVPQTSKGFQDIHEACHRSGIRLSQDVEQVLDLDKSLGWLRIQLKRLPQIQVSVTEHTDGPAIKVAPSPRAHMGPHVQKLIRDGLERAGIKDAKQDGQGLNVRMEDVVAASKDQRDKYRLPDYTAR